MLGVQRVLADDKLGEVVDGAGDGTRLEFERCLAEAIETGHIGLHPHEDPVAELRIDHEAAD